MPIYRKLNKSFFKFWSYDMAYILGFFAADGCMIKNDRGACFIDFHTTDLLLLRKIRKTLGSNHKISKIKRRDNWKKIYRLQIGSKEIFNDLEKLGFVQNKSRRLRMPKIPEKFIADFVREYFDGDEGVYFKKYYVKDRRKERWVFSLRFVSGSFYFFKDLHESLKGTTKKGFIQKKKNKDRATGYSLDFSNRDEVALFNFMYNNTEGLFLKRKKLVFEKAINYFAGVA